MLEVQRYLRGGKTLADLKEELGIAANPHKTYPSLYTLKYGQVGSPDGHPIVRECRGLIVDAANDWEVVGRGFDRFFRAESGNADTIDWSTARVQEKLDGSLMILYPYNGEWQVASSGTPDASGQVNGFEMTFRDLFWKTFYDQRKAYYAEKFPEVEVQERLALCLPDPTAEAKDLCFIFELMTPYNRVVVRHPVGRLVLLAVRDRMTGEYGDWSIGGIPKVTEFPLTSIEEIIASYQEFEGIHQEGYVVVDAAGHRVKCKHPGYDALHHLMSNMGPKYLVQLVCTGQVEASLAAFPEWAEEMAKVKAKYDAIVAQIEADYARLKNIPEQKAFALEAVKTVCSAALFQLRQGKYADVRSCIASMSLDRAMQLLGVKDVPQESPADS